MLVQAGVEHVGARAKRLGGAVAVVHVPVEDEHALYAELAPRQLGRDGDVVEQAEAHRTVGFGVVPRRAQRRKTHPSLPGEQCAHQLTGASCGVQRGAVGILADDRVGIGSTAAGRRQL